MLPLQLPQILLKLFLHSLSVDPSNLPQILQRHRLPQVARPLPPGNPVRNQKKMGVVPIFIDDAADVAEDVRLFAAGGAVGFGFDQDGGVLLVGNGEIGRCYSLIVRRFDFPFHLWTTFTSYPAHSAADPAPAGGLGSCAREVRRL